MKPPTHIEGGYRQLRLTIGLADGTNFGAWVYFAKKSSNDSKLRHYTWYRRFLIEGAREHTLQPTTLPSSKNSIAVDDLD